MYTDTGCTDILVLIIFVIIGCCVILLYSQVGVDICCSLCYTIQSTTRRY